jgi:hypothetical protein
MSFIKKNKEFLAPIFKEKSGAIVMTISSG